MREARPQADVHLAISPDRGRGYDAKTMEAPVLLAKGADHVAHKYKQVGAATL